VSWREQLEHLTSFKMWRLARLCFLWCIWREWNAKSFEGHETEMLELKKMMFQYFYTWRGAWNGLPIFYFSEFLEFCSFFATL
jgi:hypothetical protein